MNKVSLSAGAGPLPMTERRRFYGDSKTEEERERLGPMKRFSARAQREALEQQKYDTEGSKT